MTTLAASTQPYHGLFRREDTPAGIILTRSAERPEAIPDPAGRLLRVATVEASARAICPSCLAPGRGGYVSFEQDLRLAYACPSCEGFIWLAGA